MCSHSNLHTLYILNLGLWCLSAWLNKMLVSGVFAVCVSGYLAWIFLWILILVCICLCLFCLVVLLVYEFFCRYYVAVWYINTNMHVSINRHFTGNCDYWIMGSSGWSFIVEAGVVNTSCILRLRYEARLREIYVILVLYHYSHI